VKRQVTAESGWKGAIPSHWEFFQLRRALHVRSGDFISTDDFVSDGFPIFGGNGFRGYASGWNTESDTLLIGRYGALCGNVHHVNSRVWATEHAFRVLKRKEFATRFMFYVIQSLNLNQYSARAAQPGLNSTVVEEQYFAFPPIIEQIGIANFLDRETAKIDGLIAKQTEFLVKLDEHRRALVTEAVTLGLDASVPMQETEISTFALIPAHWRVKRLKHITDGVTVGVVVTPAKYYAKSGIPALRSFNVKDMEIMRSDLAWFSPESNQLLAKSILRSGDLVAVRTGKPGTTAVVPPDLDGANCIDLIIIRQSNRFDSRYLSYVMNSDLARSQYAEGSEGALQQHFNIETAKNLLLPLPPLDDQIAICRSLDERLGRLQVLRAKCIEEVERFHERRSALTTAAVTGQIDVTDPALHRAAA
jgi:type I restriction enzyme S subunit